MCLNFVAISSSSLSRLHRHLVLIAISSSSQYRLHRYLVFIEISSSSPSRINCHFIFITISSSSISPSSLSRLHRNIVFIAISLLLSCFPLLNRFANFRTIQFSELIEFFCILNDREKNLIIELYFEKIQKVKNSILLQI